MLRAQAKAEEAHSVNLKTCSLSAPDCLGDLHRVALQRSVFLADMVPGRFVGSCLASAVGHLWGRSEREGGRDGGDVFCGTTPARNALFSLYPPPLSGGIRVELGIMFPAHSQNGDSGITVSAQSQNGDSTTGSRVKMGTMLPAQTQNGASISVSGVFNKDCVAGSRVKMGILFPAQSRIGDSIVGLRVKLVTMYTGSESTWCFYFRLAVVKVGVLLPAQSHDGDCADTHSAMGGKRGRHRHTKGIVFFFCSIQHGFVSFSCLRSRGKLSP